MRSPSGQTARAASAFAQLLREYLTAHAELAEVFSEEAPEAISFEAVRALVDDDERSVLYRLKAKSHALFRSEQASGDAVRREALFDLAIGSLFHEMMMLRECLYQREVYAPRIETLRAAPDESSEALFAEFDRILAKSVARLNEVVGEVRVLLGQTRDQLRRLLVERADDRVVTRCLLSHREQVDAAFPEGFLGLLEEIHGDPISGLLESARALLESAYFPEALRALREASRALREADPEASGARAEIDQLRLYAEGMQAFLDGDYAPSIAALEAWLETGAPQREADFARLAASALGRLGRLVDDDARGLEIADGAKQLQLRLEAAPA